jgi:ribosomal protein L15
MALDDFESTPPIQHTQSVASSPSRLNNAFGRGGRGEESSGGGRGGGGTPTRESTRRERGTNVPRYPRTPPHTNELESECTSEILSNTIKEIEEAERE